MKPILQVAVVIALLAPSLASAGDPGFPGRRPGLWVATLNQGGQTIVSRSCVDPATDRGLLLHSIKSAQRAGGSLTVSGGGSLFHVTVTRNVSGHAIIMTEDVHFISDVSIQASVHTRFDPPMPQGAAAAAQISSASKWSGPCPADMRPGDLIVSGQKIHISPNGGD